MYFAILNGPVKSQSDCIIMHEELWAGPDLKLQYAEFHLERMGQSLEPPERTHGNVALEASGTILATNWEKSFYPHLDAFFSTTRSIPEIIQCCFGADLANREMKDWFDQLTPDERDRRNQFSAEFDSEYRGFRLLRLSTVRHIIEHRTGVAPVTVAISGRFGVTHVGNPTQGVPPTETRQIDDPDLAFLAKPSPVQPRWDDFDIEGKPLFAACREYLDCAHALVQQGREIAVRVHDAKQVTPPPT